ncbi:MAG TPA: glycosyltransferase family 1 protein [Acetobacteraceae bacterium]
MLRHAMQRLILDISTIARWTGPPVGIVRVEFELAQHVIRRRPDVLLTFYDPVTESLRALELAWQEIVLGLDGAVDTVGIDFRRHRARWRNLLSFRYPAIMRLERHRLIGSAMTQAAAGAMQALALGSSGRRAPFADRFGRRLANVPYDLALGPQVQPDPDDTLLSAGSDWLHKGTAMLSLQRRHGFRMAVMCYDLLPLLHPEFFPAEELPRFRTYWDATLQADVRILCNSFCVAQDVRTYAAAHRLGNPATTIVPLAASPPPQGALPALRSPLQAGRFALFVSTLEPRKGHAMLLEAWRRLLQRGVPQRADFRMLFVGRTGWMMEDMVRQLEHDGRRDPYAALHWEGVDDLDLARLYRDCAFCLYPSRYEGFGLPIVEAFMRGKAVIASTGGAVPETVHGLSPCLDPRDVDAWTDLLGEWIERPEAHAAWEARIRSDFRPREWPEVADQIMAAAFAPA